MKNPLALVGKSAMAGALVLGLGVSGAEAQDTVAGCACVHNKTNVTISYRHKWEEKAWHVVKLQPNNQQAICWGYAVGSKYSPELTFQLDVDMTKGNAWTTFNLPRMQSTDRTCEATPRRAHYDITYRSNTNNQFIEVTHR